MYSEHFDEEMNDALHEIQASERERILIEERKDALENRILEFGEYKSGLMEIGISEETFYRALDDVLLSEKQEEIKAYDSKRKSLRVAGSEVAGYGVIFGGFPGALVGAGYGVYWGIAELGIVGGAFASIFTSFGGLLSGGLAGAVAGAVVAAPLAVARGLSRMKMKSLKPGAECIRDTLADVRSDIERKDISALLENCTKYDLNIDYDAIVERALEKHIEEYEAKEQAELNASIEEEKRKMLPLVHTVDYVGLATEVKAGVLG